MKQSICDLVLRFIKTLFVLWQSLHEKCPYSKFFGPCFLILYSYLQKQPPDTYFFIIKKHYFKYFFACF